MDQIKGEASPVRSPLTAWKVFKRVLIGIVVVVVVASLGISVYAASALTRPQRKIEKSINPGVYGLEYEEFTYPARIDGMKIAAWYIPSDENQRAIILVHGWNDSRTNAFLKQFVKFASDLHKAGFSVMMIDLRGHGESADSRFTFGIKERRDVLGAVDWLEGRGYLPGKIGMLGYSLGAGSVIGAAAEEPDIGAVWVDSLYTDVKPPVERGATSIYGLPKFLVYTSQAMIRLLYGYNIAASRPIDEIGKIAPRPIFLAHCQHDELIPVSNMQQLAAVAQNVQTWIIPNCDASQLKEVPADLPKLFYNHALGYPLNPEEYTQKVVQFFDQTIR